MSDPDVDTESRPALYKVLVLGAGASKPYHYPLGSELRKRILELQSGSATRSGVIDRPDDTKHLHDFQSAFHYSGLYSIDAFLGRRKDFERIGKRCIAALLLENEDSRSFLSANNEHWYEYLLNEITVDSWDELDFSGISVITFNYDRSLETYLLVALKNGYGRTEAEVVAKIKTMNIVHVYGTLGETLPGSTSYFLYDGSAGRDKVSAAAQHLKVIPEGRMSSDTLVEARRLLSNARHIAFLGFGFDLTNVERLAKDGACGRQIAVGESVHTREIIATCIGMRDLEVSSAFESLTGSSYKPFARKSPFQSKKCYDLLRDSLFLRK